MKVHTAPRVDPMLTGRGFVYLIIVSVCVGLLGAAQMQVAGLAREHWLTVIVVMLISGNAGMRAPTTTWKAYLRRGIVTVVGANMLLWVYVGSAMLFRGIEPEYLRRAIELLPVSALGLLVVPSIAERWAEGPSYQWPIAGTKPSKLVLLVVVMSALYAAILMGATALTSL